MPKIDISSIPGQVGSTYPEPFNSEMEGRTQYRLGKHAGLTQFGANLVRLAPGAKSSLRHWHENQDEFLVVTKGTATLVEDTETVDLQPGECAAFPANNPNGHHIVNRTSSDVEFIVTGTHTATETAHYSDVDMMVRSKEGQFDFTKRDGSPLDGTK